MGRHRKQSARNVGRGSVIALTGLVPAGVVAVTTASAAEVNTAEQTALSTLQQDPGDAGASPDSGTSASHATLKAATHPGPPVVKTVAQPDGRASADLPAGPLGLPGIAQAAYQGAERTLAQENPTCHMPWSVLAGIGQVESHHANGKADAKGNPLDPIYGPVLDGSLGGNQVVDATDADLDGGGSSYARALGPMQFLPETWRKHAGDGNGDGIADPQNLFDAALTAGKYLCDGGLDMNDLGQQSRAIMRYNNSMAYVANVMAWEAGYRTGAAPASAELPQI